MTANEPMMRPNDAAVELLRQLVHSQQETQRDVKTLIASQSKLEGMNIAGQFIDVKQDLKSVIERVDRLESKGDKTDGMTGLVAWLSRNAPWLVTGAVGIAAWLSAKGIIPSHH
jgi:hypothetical protein